MPTTQGHLNRFERHPTITLISVFLVAFLAIDVILAILYKTIFGHPFYQHAQKAAERVSIESQRIETSYRVPSPIYHHTFRKKSYIPNAGYGYLKYPMSTDSLGFKSATIQDTPLSSNNYRILFIGDSFTEGVGLEYSKTFVGIIAKKLSHDNIEVLNAAVAGYSPVIYWRKIKYLIEDVGLKFDEVIVFIDISDIHDEAVSWTLSEHNTVVHRPVLPKEHKEHAQDKHKERAENAGNTPTHQDRSIAKYILRNHSILLYVILNGLYDFLFTLENRMTEEQLQRHNNARYSTNKDEGRWTLDDKLFQDYGKNGLDLAATHMDLLVELLNSHEIALAISVHPWPDQIINNDLHSVQVDFWKVWAQERNVSLLNYFPCFVKYDNSDADSKATIQKFYFHGDFHWNNQGHKLIAENFVSFHRQQSGNCMDFVTRKQYPAGVVSVSIGERTSLLW